jgi:NDP-sugar pyrophosphorylase family protein
MNVAVLCGGAGTRLKEIVGTSPKILAPIGNKKFIDYLIDYLTANKKIERVYWLLGIGASEVQTYIESIYPNTAFLNLYVIDNKLNKGTGSALRDFAEEVPSEDFMCLFGDSLPNLDLEQVYGYFSSKQTKIGLTYISKNLVSEVPNVNKSLGNSIYYSDKFNLDFNFVDYGVTYFNTAYIIGTAFVDITDIKKIIAKCSESSQLFGLEVHKPFIEIGTPLSYAEAIHKLK